jgi:hypothetical protein
MTKAAMIMELLNKHPEWSLSRIARETKAHVSYVHTLRKNMAHLDNLMDNAVAEVAEAGDVDAVLEQRGSRYGPFVLHAEITQTLKYYANQFLRRQGKELDFDQQEALDMIFHKIGRIINGDPDYSDSWIDIAGYAKLVADRLEGRSR